ncbi:hypothetical protein BDV95DRAFT_612486 [Massariosphaeria phaeospora]|uniref:Uncharacterized protein n=1 Tax=Massariosphaeria phaeospora TaxID=100035 RepID=A0A7C8HYY1_9PLEO|nr:hypothetical protein BDV95DRAFT_612486 [Massariosphaeria phaeospora]
MPVFVNFALGAKEAYFFNSPTHWAWHNLPPDVEALFTKQPALRDVLELALGEDGAYFVSYRDFDGRVLCRHYNLPNPLTTYLYASSTTGHPTRDLPTLSITLGPFASYYAHDAVSASWSNLPPALETALLARLYSQDGARTQWKDGGREAPSFVSLGEGGRYFMRTVKGGGSWDLKVGGKGEGEGEGGEQGLVGTNRFLDECRDFGGVAGLYLFPASPPSYVLLLTTGKAFSNLPEHTWADYNKMAPALPPLVQTQAPIPAVPQTQVQQVLQQLQQGQQQPAAVGQVPQQPPVQQLQQQLQQPLQQQQAPHPSYTHTQTHIPLVGTASIPAIGGGVSFSPVASPAPQYQVVDPAVQQRQLQQQQPQFQQQPPMHPQPHPHFQSPSPSSPSPLPPPYQARAFN